MKICCHFYFRGITLLIQHRLLAFTRLLHHVGRHQIYNCAIHVDLYETSYSNQSLLLRRLIYLQAPINPKIA